jgi:hypothetical protein
VGTGCIWPHFTAKLPLCVNRDDLERTFMKVRMIFGMGIVAGALLLTGSLALGQATTGIKTPAASKADTAQATNINSGAATDRQDQFGHASGKQSAAVTTPVANANSADGRSLDSAHANEASQKKHLAGVKYEDRTVPSTGAAATSEPSKMAIAEQGIAKPAKPAKPQQ